MEAKTCRKTSGSPDHPEKKTCVLEAEKVPRKGEEEGWPAARRQPRLSSSDCPSPENALQKWNNNRIEALHADSHQAVGTYRDNGERKAYRPTGSPSTTQPAHRGGGPRPHPRTQLRRPLRLSSKLGGNSASQPQSPLSSQKERRGPTKTHHTGSVAGT